jgi:hypothetical protein
LGTGGSFGGARSLYEKVLDDHKYAISKADVVSFLKNIDSYTLHAPARKKHITQRVIIGSVNELHQSDLMDMSSLAQFNNNFRFIIVVIDCFSKKVWAKALKNKTGESVVEALEQIYHSTPFPDTFESDFGSEYKSSKVKSFLRNNNVLQIMPYGLTKSQMAERVIRTLKSLLWRFFNHNNTYKYINILPKLLLEYNNRIHTSTKMKPNDVNETNEKEVFNTLFGDLEKEVPKTHTPKFRIGDFVRISKYKHIFEKAYTQNYTEEIFRVRAVLDGFITQYRLSDMQDDEVVGKFYESELIATHRGVRAH